MSKTSDIVSFSLDDYITLEIIGDKRLEFLQGQMTADIHGKSKNLDTLFCNEKGFIISNATIIVDKNIQIIIKKDVSEIMQSELRKFSKFFRCEINLKEENIVGTYDGSNFKKNFSNNKVSKSNQDWDLLKITNFDYDIDEQTCLRVRPSDLGYDLGKYVSFTKGCYRGQEIIARLKYLSNKQYTSIVFKNLTEEEHIDLESQAKLIYQKKLENDDLSHYSFKTIDQLDESLKIKIIASQLP